MEQRLCRPLGPDDLPDALRLYHELTAPRPVSADPARFAEVLSHPGTTIWGAEVGGRIVAMLTLHLLPNMTTGGAPYALMDHVVTLQAHQGQGHGRAVMQRALAAVADAGGYKVMLLTGQGRDARGFYEKMGFSASEKYGMTLRFDPAV